MSLSERPPEHVIQEVLSRFPHERAELLPALDELNGQLGYLPREAIESAARHFRLPIWEVIGPATFYSMWNVGARPVEAVQLCDDGPCHAAGAADVRRALEKAGVTVKRTSCIGQCGCGPVVTTGTRLYRRVTPDSVRAILAGEEPKPLSLADEILGIEMDDRGPLAAAQRRQDCPQSLDEAVAAGAYQALRKALTMTPEQVVAEMTTAGLQGRGGAGFPAGLKMRFTAAGAKSSGGRPMSCATPTNPSRAPSKTAS